MRKILLALLVVVLVAPATFGQTKAGPFQGMPWNEIILQARKEARVVWYQWYFQPQFRTFCKKFTEKYGIEVVIPDGTHDGNLNKFLAERKRKSGDIDVISFGGDNTYKMNMPEYFFGPLTTVIPGGDRLKTAIQGGNSQGYAVAFWGNQTGLAYNPARVKESQLPQTVDELGAWMQANPKRFGFNLENGGAGPAFIESLVQNIVPGLEYDDGEAPKEKMDALAPAWKWFMSHKDQFVITASNADSITRLNDGEFFMVAAWEDHLAGLQKSKTVDSKLKLFIPSFGMPGGGNMAGVAANAPHKAAALLFIQWLSSSEVQTQFNAEFGSAPQHPDSDESSSLVSMKQRANSRLWIAKPFGDSIKKAFADNVLLK